MKMMIEGYVMMIGIVLICALSAGYVSVSLQISQARSFHSATIHRLETSHFASSVQEDCINEAKVKGYELTLENKTLYDTTPFLLVELNYDVKMPFLNIISNGQIQGYAR